MTGRAIRSVVAAAVAGLLFSGCWLQPGFDAGHTRFNDLEDTLTAANVDTLAQDWSIDLDTTASEPIVKGGRVYVAMGGTSPTSRLTARAGAYDVATGAEVWKRTFGDICCSGGTAEITPTSFVGDELWTGFLVISTIGPRPIGDYGAPTRLNAADGTVINKGAAGVVDATTAVPSGDAVVQVWVNITTPPARQLVVRDKATLATLWTATLPGDLALGPVTVDPTVADGQVFAADQNTLHAFPLAGCGAATCPATWSLDLGAKPTNLAAAPGGDTVLVTRGTDLVAVDRATGTIAWSAPLGATAPGVAIADGTVYVGAGTTLSTFAAAGCGAATCAPTATATLASAAGASPVVAGGVVYVGGTDSVEAFAADGSLDPLATVAIPGTASNLTVDSGRLFVTSRPGTAPTKLSAYSPAP